MSDTNQTETNTDNTDEPTKAELHDRVRKLESTVEKLMPSRRDALKLGAAGIAGAAGLSATSQTADASTGSAGTIGSSGSRPDAFLDEANVNQLTGVSTGGDRQGCRAFLNSGQTSFSGDRVKIAFDSVVYDSGNNFDISSHAWTCPKDGLYMANLQVTFASAGTTDGNVDRREVIIATPTTVFPSGEGAYTFKDKAGQNDILRATTLNKYSSGDKIATYAQNFDSNDTLQGGNTNEQTFIEIAFLGGL